MKEGESLHAAKVGALTGQGPQTPMITTISPNNSPTMGKLFEALSKAQAMMGGAAKDSNNPFFKSKYADLHQVWEVIREPFGKNGLSVMQPMIEDGDKLYIHTILGHSSGEWMRSITPVRLKGNDTSNPQVMGSGITYARRYALAAICGVAQMDDDGNGASGAKNPKVDTTKTPRVSIAKNVRDDFLAQVRGCVKESDGIAMKELFEEWTKEEQVYLWGLFSKHEKDAINKIKDDMKEDKTNG